MIVSGRTFGLNSLLLLVAIILFVLAFAGVKFGSFNELDIMALGLAFGFGSFLLV